MTPLWFALPDFSQAERAVPASEGVKLASKGKAKGEGSKQLGAIGCDARGGMLLLATNRCGQVNLYTKSIIIFILIVS